MATSDDNKPLIAHIIEQGFNSGNLDVADGRFHDDYVAHVPACRLWHPARVRSRQ